MDTEVKQTVRKIFNNLRKEYGVATTRKSDRVDIDRILQDHQPIDTLISSKD